MGGGMTDLSWEEFRRVDMRVGRVVGVEPFLEARKPSYKMTVDFGPLGTRKTSAAVAPWYEPGDLEGRLVVAVVNFPPKQIANFLSEVLVLGAVEEDGRVVLLRPDDEAELGARVA